MKILLLTCDFPPVLKSAARIFFELAEDLSKYGHEVTVLTVIPERFLAEKEERYGLRFIVKEKVNGIQVWRVRNFPGPRHWPMVRLIEHFWMALVFFLVGLSLPRQDGVIVYSPPLTLGLAGYGLSWRWKGIEILNVQDIYPQTAIDLGLLRNRAIIALAEWLERFLYCRADAITVHSQGNREYLINKGASKQRTHVVHNWVDLRQLPPGSPRNGWRQKHGLDGHFVVSFAGTMGFAQGLERILEAANRLREHPDIAFVLAGDGVFHHSLEREARQKNLTNVRFLPPQPTEAYHELLRSSDACLVTLHRNLKTPVIPGKLQSAMAAGKPVICSSHPASDLGRFVQEMGCGFFVPGGDPSNLAEAVLTLHKNRGMAMEMGQKGRIHAEKDFDREACTLKYENLLRQLKNKGTRLQ